MWKWADYLISAVRYDPGGTRITHVNSRITNGSGEGEGREEPRSVVVRNMDSGFSYCTVYRTQGGGWQKGADVHIVEVDGETFIRTDANAIKHDNLGDLPVF